MSVSSSVTELLGLDEEVEDARELVLEGEGNIFPEEDDVDVSDSELVDLKRVVDFAKDGVDDYKHARIVHQRLINRGVVALDGMLTLAHGSNQPRAYEVVATLINTVSGTTRDLIKLQESMQKLNETVGSEMKGTVNNNLIVSTSADLAKILDGMDGK